MREEGGKGSRPQGDQKKSFQAKFKSFGLKHLAPSGITLLKRVASSSCNYNFGREFFLLQEWEHCVNYASDFENTDRTRPSRVFLCIEGEFLALAALNLILDLTPHSGYFSVMP